MDSSTAATIAAVINTSAAALPTSYIVSLFKSAKPEASTSAVITMAVIGGIVTSFLIAISTGSLVVSNVSGPAVALVILQAIGSAAMAAGVSRTDNSANKVVDGKQS